MARRLDQPKVARRFTTYYIRARLAQKHKELTARHPRPSPMMQKEILDTVAAQTAFKAELQLVALRRRHGERVKLAYPTWND